jgi:hypothetical protein
MENVERQYHDGLRAHINTKASESGPQPDAESLAASIVEYRRNFIGDHTKVLDLGVGGL